MSEANLWEWLRDVALPLGQYSRIETGDTSPGFPDVHCQLEAGLSPTLELKFAKHPGAHIPFTKKSGMRRSQIKWIKENLRNGGTVWIIAEITPEILVIPGKFAGDINGTPEKEVRKLAIGILHKKNPRYAAEFLRKLLVESSYE